VNELPRQKICELIGNHPRIAEDSKLCESLLKDVCGDHRKEINLLVSAVKEQIPQTLSQSQGAFPELVLSNLVMRMHDSLGLEESSAQWAVASWAIALGVVSPDYKFPHHKTPEPNPVLKEESPSELPTNPATSKVPSPSKSSRKWLLISGGLATVAVAVITVTGIIPKPDPRPSPSPTQETLKGNYTQLEKHLKERNLKASDEETFRVMIQVAGQKSIEQGYFDLTEWKSFSCADLNKIDQLWREATAGKQGFSAQRKVLEAQGKGKDAGQKYLNQVGLKQGNDNLVDFNYDEQTKVTKYTEDKEPKFANPPEGQLPAMLYWRSDNDYRFDAVYRCKIRGEPVSSRLLISPNV
jgi:hypothetical protein